MKTRRRRLTRAEKIAMSKSSPEAEARARERRRQVAGTTGMVRPAPSADENQLDGVAVRDTGDRGRLRRLDQLFPVDAEARRAFAAKGWLK